MRTKEAQAWYAEKLACKPEKPLDKGEIFALAMQDYWKKKLHGLWVKDKNLSQFYPQRAPVTVTERDCQLIRDEKGNPVRIGNDTCYPWKIEQYNTLDKLETRLQDLVNGVDYEGKGTRLPTFIRIVHGLLQGEVNHPETEQLYGPDSYNRDADFAVILRDGDDTYWYPKDCCRLMSYAEVVAENKRLGKRNPYYVPGLYFPNRPPETRMEDLFFLRIKKLRIESSFRGGGEGLARGRISPPYARGEDTSGGQGKSFAIDRTKPIYLTIFFAVSPCGVILSHWKAYGKEYL